jgi:hypothetical protein
MVNVTGPLDLVKRFSLTPLHAQLSLSGKMISLETNHQMLVDRLAGFSMTSVASAREEACSLRIVTESDDCSERSSAQSLFRCARDSGLAFVNMNQHGFIAYDERANRAIAFISEGIVRDEELFLTHFLPALTSLLSEGNVTP